MMGKSNSGHVRAAQIDNKTRAKISKALQQKIQKQQQHSLFGGTTTVKKQLAGTTSVSFTPVQGLEIVNPNAAQEKVDLANQKYFGTDSGFASVRKKAA